LISIKIYSINSTKIDWYDYGFRFYDPAIGRFPSLDPLADRFAHVSPYNYAENRPIDGIDLWGLQWVGNTAIMVDAQKGNSSSFSGKDYMNAVVKGTAKGFSYGGKIASMFTGNPLALILMPTAIGLSIANDVKPDVLPENAPDCVTGAVFSVGDEIVEEVTGQPSDIFQETGELIESLATGKGLFKKVKNASNLVDKVTKPVEIVNEVIDVVEEVKNSTGKNSNNSTTTGTTQTTTDNEEDK